MFPQDYPNLRTWFHKPLVIPKREFVLDHNKYVVSLERRFGGVHQKETCLYCGWVEAERKGLKEKARNIKEDSEREIMERAQREAVALEPLVQSPYNPFNIKLKRDHWLNFCTQAMKERTQGKHRNGPLSFAEICKTDIDRVFFATLTKEDVDQIRDRVNIQEYKDIDEMYFIAGLYEEERQCASWENRRSDPITVGIFDYSTAPQPTQKGFYRQLESAVRADTITREHRNRLCSDCQQAGMIGNADAMIQLYIRLEEFCRAAHTWPRQMPALYIHGVPGTGKERIAHAIHRLSGRKGDLVTCNCAAFPDNLIESELFGYAKGAFTGAATDRPGLFEQASGGTLFLDEINKMTLPQQGKLLRALEYREVRRVGSNRARTVDVLTVVASNIDLDQTSGDTFLRDLRSRLTPEPLRVPQLHERPEDIPLLAKHFLTFFPGTPLGDYHFPVALWCMEKQNDCQGQKKDFEVRDLLNEVRRLVFSVGPPETGDPVSQVKAVLQGLKKAGCTISITSLSKKTGFGRQKFYDDPLLRDLVRSFTDQNVIRPRKAKF